ncbi:MAG: superoxide dismutase family protein [Caldimonas sp.]
MKLGPVVLAPLAALLVAGCAMPPSPAAAPPYVVAVLKPTQGNSAAGTIYLIQDGSKVQMRGQVSGLKPNQEHGFHVHEKGDCASADGMSAAGHLNPNGKPHGPQAAEHHAGDLPALRADAAGTAKVRVDVPGTVLGSGAADFAGKALIVHAGPDDYATQPTGNSGARLACGVIRMP